MFARGNSAPLTGYFIWPRADAWEELKIDLESKPWVGDKEKVELLNRLTLVSQDEHNMDRMSRLATACEGLGLSFTCFCLGLSWSCSTGSHW